MPELHAGAGRDEEMIDDEFIVTRGRWRFLVMTATERAQMGVALVRAMGGGFIELSTPWRTLRLGVWRWI